MTSRSLDLNLLSLLHIPGPATLQCSHATVPILHTLFVTARVSQLPAGSPSQYPLSLSSVRLEASLSDPGTVSLLSLTHPHPELRQALLPSCPSLFFSSVPKALQSLALLLFYFYF